MPYSAVTKPSVGDPIKLSTIEGLIDNQTFFNTSLDTSSTFNADGNFEATPSGGDPAQGWTKTGAAVVIRSSTSSDPNSNGEYCLKFGGSASDAGVIETDIFPIDEYKAYVISAGFQVDDTGDQFKVEFISYQRDGSTGPVQTVQNPRHYDGTNTGINDTTWKRHEWVVDGGTNGRWAKLKITWTCNSSSSSAGYLDSLTIEPMHREVRYVLPDFYGNGANTLDCYCPRWCKTEFTTYDANNDLVASASSWRPTTTNGPAGTSDFHVDESDNTTYYADVAQEIDITGGNTGSGKSAVVIYTPRWT